MKTKPYAFIIIIAVLILQGCHYTGYPHGSYTNSHYYLQPQPGPLESLYRQGFLQPDPTVELRNQTRILQEQLDLQKQQNLSNSFRITPLPDTEIKTPIRRFPYNPVELPFKGPNVFDNKPSIDTRTGILKGF